MQFKIKYGVLYCCIFTEIVETTTFGRIYFKTECSSWSYAFWIRRPIFSLNKTFKTNFYLGSLVHIRDSDSWTDHFKLLLEIKLVKLVQPQNDSPAKKNCYQSFVRGQQIEGDNN